MKTDIYKQVTDKILAQLENGTAPWVKPWSAQAFKGGAFAHNAVSKRQYSSVNVVLLWMARDENGYSANRWLTFKQAKEAGGTVRKGEKGTMVVFVSHMEREDEKTGETVRIPFLKRYTVFNVEQCDGLAERVTGESLPMPVNKGERAELADQFIDATGADFTEQGGDRAYYSPSNYAVRMPRFEQFRSTDHFYATAFHELSHWTGHKTRLNRDFSGRFGSRSYAAEELVAELSAAFLCAEFGFDGDLRHAAYIKSWISLLKDDSRAFITAASKAQQAADHLRHLALQEEKQAA